MEISVFTDGACQNNPGLGGWGAFILCHNEVYCLWGGKPWSTNNKMELQGVLEGLIFLKNRRKQDSKIVVYSDSQYVVKGITSWIYSWKRNNWKTSNKKPVENQDLWEELWCISQEFSNISWQWVRGHDGSRGNNKAHELAQRGLFGSGEETISPSSLEGL